MPRMKILNSVERGVFDSPPIFNSAERKRCFDFPAPLKDIATSLRTSTNQVVFLLSCGYFKATKRFYPVPTFHQRDLAYVADRIAAVQERIDLTDYRRQTMARHQAAILEFYGYRTFKPHGRMLLAAEIALLVQSHLKPKLIFSRVIEVLVRDKVEVPGYFPLAALILTAINQLNRRLTGSVETLLTSETRALLDALLLQEATEEGSPPGKTVAYKLTSMKKLSQSTKPSKVKERVAELKLVQERFRLLKPVLDHLNLGPDGIQYYAYGVIKAEIFQLTRRAAHERYPHLTAFITHQYYRLHDNLVDVLWSSLQSFQNSAQREHKDQCYVRREQRNDSLKTLVGFLDHGVLETLAKIKGVTTDSELSDTEKGQRISALLANNHTAQSLDADQIEELKAAMITQLSEDGYYLVLQEFQHWQQRYHHGRPEERVIYAGVIGLGCTIGIRKMARISHPLSETELENAINWYFSVDNVNAADDRVLQLMDRLELPNLLRRTQGRLHTSSDGQKFEVRVDSLNANHSFKYFGKEQGVSVYTFRDERDLLWHSLVFSSADRESAYVIDGLLHNDVVKSDIHSTDEFGYSEAIFATSNLVGVAYAPRFKNLKRHRRYIFRSRQSVDRSSWKIQSMGYVDEDHIIQFWDDILRFIATIKLKETTATDIFRRLNSYSKQHGLYQALKAFGQPLKSLFILRVIDEPVLRMSIEKVLHGVEHVHRFTRAVSVGSPREFLQAEKEDQEMAEACKRLIKNCIICWNYL
jgi:TnpA family transposase